MSGKKTKIPGAAGIVFGVTAYFLLFMSCFLLCFKLVVDSNIEAAAGEIFIADEEKISIFIPRGSNTKDIAENLKRNGVINSTLLFRFLSNVNGYDGDYKYGTHYVKKGLKYDQLMAILTSYPEGIRVMIPEGYNIMQIADKFAKEGLVDKEKFLQVAENYPFDYIFLENIPDNTKNRLEGFLFPDTYFFDRNAGEIDIIDMMLTNFDNRFPPHFYDRAKELGLTVYDVITLASIVEKEAAELTEMPRVAGVFLNRLSGKYDIARKLDSCATIQYCIYRQTGSFKEKLSDEDTKIDDPYNTYIHEGLPPGPISNPGRAAIEAVLYPEEGNFLFFVAKGDGTHYFSRTLEEHNYALSMYGYVQWVEYTPPPEE